MRVSSVSALKTEIFKSKAMTPDSSGRVCITVTTILFVDFATYGDVIETCPLLSKASVYQERTRGS